MMDVNRFPRTHAVGDKPYRQPTERHRGQADDNSENKARSEDSHAWSADKVVDLVEALSGDLPPEMRTQLRATVEEMRSDLGLVAESR